jgi:hypothetical protein
MSPADMNNFLSEVNYSVVSTLNLADLWMSSGKAAENKKYLSEIRKRMTESGGIIRESKKVKEAAVMAQLLYNELHSKIGAGSVNELADSFLLMDHCLTHFVYLGAISFYLDNGGRSRGSYIVTESTKAEINGKSALNLHPELCDYDRDVENKILEVGIKNMTISFKLVDVRKIPDQDLWFERVWKEYLKDNYADS